MKVFLALACAKAGDTGRARALLQQVLAIPRDKLVSARPLIVVYAALGEMDAAFDCLERAFDARDTVLLSILSVAVYDGLRLDPRYDPLAARVRAALGMVGTVRG